MVLTIEDLLCKGDWLVVLKFMKFLITLSIGLLFEFCVWVMLIGLWNAFDHNDVVLKNAIICVGIGVIVMAAIFSSRRWYNKVTGGIFATLSLIFHLVIFGIVAFQNIQAMQLSDVFVILILPVCRNIVVLYFCIFKRRL